MTAVDVPALRGNAAVLNLARATILARYGSEEAAWEPCERERRLLAAVAQWRGTNPEFPGWTTSLDGWTGIKQDGDAPPAHIVQAITAAEKLPSTVREALAEVDYWNRRDADLKHLAGDPDGDSVLDLVVQLRMSILLDLAVSAHRQQWPSASHSTVSKRERVAAILQQDPQRSDRSIAREVNCSPTTVAVARANMKAVG